MPPFITRVRIKNYKSIAHCDVELGPFTVLLGLNAAGKSNFLDALHFVRDALIRSPAEAVASRGGIENVLCRVPEPAQKCTIALELRNAHYELTLMRATDSDSELGVHVEREVCTLFTEEGHNHGSFQVTDGLVNNPDLADSVLTPGMLLLPKLSTLRIYSPLYNELSGMFFYNPDLTELRDAKPTAKSTTLGENGSNLGLNLALLEPEVLKRLSAYAAAIVPGLISISSTDRSGPYLAAQMTLQTSANDEPHEFRAESMSEGTIRAIGLLTAVFQRRARNGRIPLIAIEEPELALHPLAAGVLFDALTEASTHVQVLATSQSAELFDRKEADLGDIRIVQARDGVTVIGPVDPVSRSIVKDGLATVAELLRSNQLQPDSGDE